MDIHPFPAWAPSCSAPSWQKSEGPYPGRGEKSCRIFEPKSKAKAVQAEDPCEGAGVDANTAEALSWNVAPPQLHLCSAKPWCTLPNARVILHPPAAQGLNRGRKKQNSQGISQAAEEAGQRLGEVLGTRAEALQDRNLMQKRAASVTKVPAAHQDVYNLGGGEREAWTKISKHSTETEWVHELHSPIIHSNVHRNFI